MSGDIRTVSIIGSAGRGEDKPKWSADLYRRALAKSHEVITEVWGLDPASVKLVSGGAAWSDHQAVDLFSYQMGYHSLCLYLPCRWDEGKRQFVDIGSRDFRVNPGGTANAYHAHFSKKMGVDTLAQIDSVRKSHPEQVELNQTHQGFHSRNTLVSSSEFLIAFTFGEGDIPKDGGTKDTWVKAKRATKVHVCLATL
jgi:hypothetical protein